VMEDCSTDERLQQWTDEYVELPVNVKCNNDYGVQNDESLHGHGTDERRVRKRNKKVRRDVI